MNLLGLTLILCKLILGTSVIIHAMSCDLVNIIIPLHRSEHYTIIIVITNLYLDSVLVYYYYYPIPVLSYYISILYSMGFRGSGGRLTSSLTHSDEPWSRLEATYINRAGIIISHVVSTCTAPTLHRARGRLTLVWGAKRYINTNFLCTQPILVYL